METKCINCGIESHHEFRILHELKGWGGSEGYPVCKDCYIPKSCDYEKISQDVGRLVSKKQAAYGDAFGKAGEVLKILYPAGVKPEQYDDMLCIVRILDKLFRIANKRDSFSENPYADIAGYGILGIGKERKENDKQRNYRNTQSKTQY